MKRFFLVFLVLLCALGLYAQDYAELYILRDNVSIVSGNSHEIIINNVTLSTIPNNGYFYVQIPVGRNVVKSNTNYINYSQSQGVAMQTTLGTTITAVAGQKYYIKLLEVPLPKFSVVEKEKAKLKLEAKIAEGKVDLMGEFDVKDSAPSMQTYKKPEVAETNETQSEESATPAPQEQQVPQEESNPRLRMLRSMQGN